MAEVERIIQTNQPMKAEIPQVGVNEGGQALDEGDLIAVEIDIVSEVGGGGEVLPDPAEEEGRFLGELVTVLSTGEIPTHWNKPMGFRDVRTVYGAGSRWVTVYDATFGTSSNDPLALPPPERVAEMTINAYDEFSLQKTHLLELEAAGFFGRAEDARKMVFINNGSRCAFVVPHLGEPGRSLFLPWYMNGGEEEDRPISQEQLVRLVTTILHGEQHLGDSGLHNLVYDQRKGPCFIDVSAGWKVVRKAMLDSLIGIVASFATDYDSLPEEMKKEVPVEEWQELVKEWQEYSLDPYTNSRPNLKNL